MCVYGVWEGQLSGTSSFLSLWVPGHQTWWQVLLPTEPSHQPGFICLSVTELHKVMAFTAFVLGVKEANKQGFLPILLEDCTTVLKMAVWNTETI